jgi:hypothetical protein
MQWARLVVQVIKREIKKAFADLHTTMPAQVTGYDASTNTCSVRPCIKRIRTNDPENNSVEIGELKDVPVKLMGSGKLLLSIVPQVGSYGMLTCSERSIAEWMNSGGIVDPKTVRKFSLSDAIFDPGLYPLVDDGNNGKLAVPPATDRISLRTRTGNTEISVLDDETVVIKNATGSFEMKSSGQVDINGNFTVDP